MAFNIIDPIGSPTSFLVTLNPNLLNVSTVSFYKSNVFSFLNDVDILCIGAKIQLFWQFDNVVVALFSKNVINELGHVADSDFSVLINIGNSYICWQTAQQDVDEFGHISDVDLPVTVYVADLDCGTDKDVGVHIGQASPDPISYVV